MDGGEHNPPPLRESPNHGGDQTVTLADLIGVNEPEITIAVIGACGAQNALTLQIHHNGVDGALMAAWVHAHAPHNGGTGLRSLLNQGGADSGASDGAEVHRSGVV